jgi:hypothetical protein
MANEITPFDAVRSLKPGVTFGWNPDTKAITGWDTSKGSPPSDSEITAEVNRLQLIYDSKDYQRKRQPLYPTIEDQLDMQYWDKKNGTTTWVDAVTKVKTDNPKE